MVKTNNYAEYVRKALRNYKSDNLERAEAAFSGMIDEQLDQQYGQSGKTRREILQEYREARALHQKVETWFANVIEIYKNHKFE